MSLQPVFVPMYGLYASSEMAKPSSPRRSLTPWKCSGSPSTRTPSMSKMTAAKGARLVLQGGRAADDIEQFLRDLFLARLVVRKR